VGGDGARGRRRGTSRELSRRRLLRPAQRLGRRRDRVPRRALPRLRLRPARRRRARPLRPAQPSRPTARGRPLVVDPGRYTYSEHGANLRRWFKGTAAHSTVCVDGLDQTPYRRGKPRGRSPRAACCGASARRVWTSWSARRGVPSTKRCTSAPSPSSRASTGSSRTASGAIGRHRYDLRFQLAATAAEVEGDTVRARGSRSSSRPTPGRGWSRAGSPSCTARSAAAPGRRRGRGPRGALRLAATSRRRTALAAGAGTVVEVRLGDRVDRLALCPERVVWRRYENGVRSVAEEARA
jgi:hypothetical protein